MTVSAVAAYRLSRKLGRLRHPRATAARLIGLGAVGAAAQTADAVTRHYWPLAVLAALVSRRARRTVAAVALGSGVVDWLRAGPERPALPAFLLARPTRRPRLRRGPVVGRRRAPDPRAAPPGEHVEPVSATPRLAHDPPRGLLRKAENRDRVAPLLRRSDGQGSAIAGPFPSVLGRGVRLAGRPSLHP